MEYRLFEVCVHSGWLGLGLGLGLEFLENSSNSGYSAYGFEFGRSESIPDGAAASACGEPRTSGDDSQESASAESAAPSVDYRLFGFCAHSGC